MFIVWGKKHVYKKIGYVADFCPICNDIKGFVMKRIGLAGHIYYISAGEGELVGFERSCTDCKSSFNATLGRYLSFSKQHQAVEVLQRETYPMLLRDVADKLALADKIRNTPGLLSSAERRNHLIGAFVLLSPKVERNFATIQIDKEIGLSLIGVVAVLMIVPSFLLTVIPDMASDLSAAVGAAAVTFLIWQFVGSGRRFMVQQIVPVLAKSIAPLRPTKEEIEAILSDLRHHQHKLGRKLKSQDLMDALQSQQQK